MRFNCIISVLGIFSLIMIIVTGTTVFNKKQLPVIDNVGYTIVIDAGHGGIDGGVSGVNTGVKESEINLAIVKKLESYIKGAGMSVVLTRSTDAGLYGVATKNLKRKDMQKRKEIILKAKPLRSKSIAILCRIYSPAPFFLTVLPAYDIIIKIYTKDKTLIKSQLQRSHFICSHEMP